MPTSLTLASRLKDNFTVLREADNALLIECKQSVEDAFEKERWAMIAKAMKDKGAEDEYRPEVLKRQYKKLLLDAQMVQKGGAGGVKGVGRLGFGVRVNVMDEE